MSERTKGATSVKLLFRLIDSTTGLAKSGVDVTTLKLQYERPGEAVGTATSLTLLAALTTAWTSYGAKECDAANSKGVYRVDAPDAAFATGADEVTLSVSGAGIETSTRLIDLMGADMRNATSLGLANLDAAITSRLAPTVAARTLDVSAGGEAGLDWANVGSPATTVALSGTTVGTLTTYAGNTPQTGDAYLRLGAPASSSISADIAEVAVDADLLLATLGVPALVQAPAAAGGSSTAPANTFAAATTPGNFLVACLWTAATPGTITPPAGWTLAKAASVVGTANLYIAESAAATTSVAFTLGNSVRWGLGVGEFRGVVGTSSLDQTGSGSTGGSVTTGAANELIVAVIDDLNGTGPYSAPTGGFALQGTTTSLTLDGGWLWRVGPSGGQSYSTSVTGGSGNGVIASFRATAGSVAADPLAVAVPGSYAAGTVGYRIGTDLDAAVSSRSTYAGTDTAGTTTLLGRLTSTRAGLLDNLDAAVSTRSTYAGADTSGTTTLLSRLTAGRATNLDNLDAAVSTRMATFTYTAPPSAATVGSAVWDVALASHLTAGTTGAALDDAGSAGDPWDAALPGSYGVGTAGFRVGTYLDAAVSTRSTYAGADTSGTTTLLSRLTSTRAGLLDNLDAAVSTRSTYAGADTAGTATLLARLTSTRAGNLDSLDAAVSTRLPTSSYTAPDNADVAAVKVVTDRLATALQSDGGSGYQFTALALADAPTGGGAPTASQVATAVWADLLSGSDFAATGSVGKLLKDDVTASLSTLSTYAGTDTAGVTTLLARIPGTVQPQTGDSFARLGAPAGASIAADLAEVEGEADLLLAGVTVAGYAAGQGPAALVLDALLADHVASGSVAAGITSAGTAGDPLSSPVPGSYAAGTAGYALGHPFEGVAVEAGIDARQALQLILATQCGKSTGAGTTTVTFAAAGSPSTPRVVGALDSAGNRASTTLTPS